MFAWTIISKLESMEGFTISPGNTISCLAFADEIIFLADDADKAKRLFNAFEAFLAFRGMALSADKCAAFAIHKR